MSLSVAVSDAPRPVTAVGIDVGGARKGFHAVAITDGKYAGHTAMGDADELTHWARDRMRARAIGIDAPCRWSNDGRARHAERELMAKKIWCFSTPTRQRALDHPRNHYGWMLQGESMFQALASTHNLCQELPLTVGANVCFETFPHAIAWHLSHGQATAKRKGVERRELLNRAGIDTTRLSNIDLVDAALCALVAYQAATGGNCVAYGEPSTGLIVVPVLAASGEVRSSPLAFVDATVSR